MMPPAVAYAAVMPMPTVTPKMAIAAISTAIAGCQTNSRIATPAMADTVAMMVRGGCVFSILPVR